MSWDVVGPLMIVDLPFSVVLDTVLMSIDLIDNRPCNW
ncbi:YceK/YidQ family lipoprotein [Pseudomonas nitroreducens]